MDERGFLEGLAGLEVQDAGLGAGATGTLGAVGALLPGFRFAVAALFSAVRR